MIDAMLRTSVAGNPEGTAIVFGEHTVSYRELGDRTAALRAGLGELGVGRGDCVLVALPNCPAWIYTYFATAGLGATVLALDPELTEPELRRVAAECPPTVVVTDPARAGLLDRVGRTLPRRPALLLTGDGAPADVPHTDLTGLMARQEAGGGGKVWDSDQGDWDADWVFTYSSGSTGEPRRISRTQANQFAEASNIVRTAEVTERDVVLCPVPLFHALGQFCCLIVAVRAAATLVLIDPTGGDGGTEWTVGRVTELVGRHRVTIMPAVPYVFEALADLPAGHGGDLGSLRLCLSGSNFLTPAVRDRFERRHGVPIRQTYGSSEAGSVSWDCGPGPITPDSVGRPLSGVSVRIVGPAGEPLPSGAEGEITVSSAAVARTWRDGEETVRLDPGAPYFTGDLGLLDAEGRLYVTGRKRTLIDTGGHKVNPVEVEEVLESLPGVREAGVVALPGGVLAAAVVAAPDTEPDLVRLREACRARLADYKVPRHLVLVGALPRSSVGKIRRARLTALLTAEEIGTTAPATTGPDGAAPEDDPWAEPDPRRRARLVGDRLVALAAEVLGRTADEIDRDRTLPLRALGLDSLGALRLKMAVQEHLHRTLGLPELLGPATPAELAALLAARPAEDASAAVRPGPPTGEFPLSHNQAAIWHADRLAPDSASYHLSFAARVVSGCDPAALRRAFQALTDRHPVLRTTYAPHDGTPRQHVAAHTRVDFAELPLPADEGLDGHPALAAALESAAAEPFDLTTQVPLRIRLFTAPDRDPVLLVTQHHIATDFWSMVTLLKDLGGLYAAELTGEEYYRPAPSHTYTDYTRWLDEQVTGATGAADREHWRSALADLPPVLELPLDRPRPPVQPREGATHFHTLDKDRVERLRAFARARGTTVYTVLLATFHLLLRSLTGERDIAVAALTTNRDRQEFHDVLGYFANQVVCRVRAVDGESFDALLETVRGGLLTAMEHQLLPFAAVVDDLGVRRDPSRAPLVDLAFGQSKAHDPGMPDVSTFLAGGTGQPLRVGPLDLESVAVGQRGTVYDFSGAVYESDNAVSLAWEYSRALFDEATAKRIAGQFEEVLEAVLSDPGRPVREAEPLDQAWRERLLAASTGPAEELPTVPELIARRCAARSGDVAIVTPDGSVTLGEFAERAGRVAGALAAAGVGQGARVGLWLDGTGDAATAAAGVWQAGAVCETVAVDASAERVRQVAGRLDWLVTTGARRDLLGHGLSGDGLSGVRVLVPDEVPGGGPFTGAAPQAPALVVRTSGVTAPPRAHVVGHRALARCAALRAAEAAGGVRGGTLVHGMAAADRALVTVLTTIAAGGTAVLEPWIRTPRDLAATLGSGRAFGALQLTATQLRRLLPELTALGIRHRVAVLSVTGETLTGDLARRWRERAADPAARITHVHGSVETGLALAWGEVPDDLDDHEIAPTGTVLPGVRRYVLDDAGRLCPPGVTGEICVAEALVEPRADDGTAPSDTEVSLQPGVEGGRVWRTGDAGRYAVTGARVGVVVAGRVGDVARVRGRRLWLGDVERAIMRLPGVTVAVVTADGTSLNAQVEVVRPEGGELPDGAALRAALRAVLPLAEVPDTVTVVDRLARAAEPDLEADPGPSRDPAPAASEPEAGGSAVEAALAAIWQEVLGVAHVSADDNYFDLDGDSITALQVVALAAEQGIQLTARQLFTAATLRDLAAAARVEGPAADEPASVGSAAVDDTSVPLTPVQHWFFELGLTDVNHWNQVLAFHTAPALDPTTLTAALRTVADRHPAFRLRFGRTSDGTWTQRLDPGAEPLLLLADGAPAPGDTPGDRAAALAVRAQREIDVTRGPLLVAALAPEPESGGSLLCLAAHHLVVDLVSWQIVLDELTRTCAALHDGRDPRLPVPTTDFPAWAAALAAYATSPEVTRELDGWAESAQSAGTLAPVRTAPARPGTVTARLSAEASAALRSAPPGAPRPHEVLLAAVCHALAEREGGRRIRVDVEGHGRGHRVPGVELSRSVGWFTSVLPVLHGPVPAAADPEETLRTVLASLRGHEDGGLAHGLLRHGPDPRARETLAALPPADAGFNYLGTTGALLGPVGDEGRGQSPNPFRPVPLPPGIERGPADARPYPLEISALFAGDTLELRIGHDRGTDDGPVHELAEHVLAALHRLTPAPGAVR
ncbi:condensation domain-containing protein [Streptomyces sp. NPDC046870]|uniref:condensation domain-containing protein n=1 Tax=Streptomyces sp. NPDC046870 TaxID=3155135 RepID=UPI003457136B